MSWFKKSQDKIEAEKLYNLLSNKTSNYTIDEIKSTIIDQGYNENVSTFVLKMITDHKLPLKEKASLTSTKESVLKELSESINLNKSKIVNSEKSSTIKKEDATKKVDVKKEVASKKVETKKNLKDVNKVGFFKKVGDFFKMIYFFFEDNYYKMVDWISKAIPLNKLTDRIDKIFPSFILFLLIIALLLYLLFSGTLSFSKSWTISVNVIDPAGVPLNDTLITLQIKDENVSFLSTDVFGEAIFKDLKSKKQTINLIVSKEHYTTINHSFKLNKNNLIQTVTLLVDLDNPIIPVNPEIEREIMFVENNNVLITNATLNLTFSCTNTAKIPTPKTTLISNGRITVTSPASCGSLRVSVTSNDFASITNKTIDSTNTVLLTRIIDETGKLGFSVKNISGAALTGADVTLYNYSQSTSLLPLDSKTTDYYGLGEFSVEPKQYLLTAAKEGYLTYPKKGPLTVVKDNTTTTSFILFTKEDLINFDCSLSKYSDFCIDDAIDCTNEDLKPFLKFNSDGTCVLGSPGYINVTLKDLNTGEPVYADITLDSKLKDTNDSYEFTEYIAEDTNYHSFDVIDFYNYRIRVLNTEISGYVQPDPVIVNSLDSNHIINLEYSSALNSGKIGVNVKDNGQNISNARVYIYKEIDNDFVLTNPLPKLTNQFGDVNFELQRANTNYYAYAVHNIVDKQGTSSIEELDVNSFLQLSVDLENIPKILNLKVTPDVSYDINFYDSINNPVTTYVSVDADLNTQYYFTGSINKIYAVISYSGYTTYQTELITLVPDQEIFKEVTLTSLSSCENAKLELVGLYDKTGTLDVNNIDYINNTLNDEYRVKFRYTSCFSDPDVKSIHVRAGNQIFIDDDYVYFVSDEILVDNIDIDRGYKFSGEHVPDFNITLFNQDYTSDKGYNFSGDEYKWFEVNFINLLPNVLEFSANIKFREDPIAPIDFYNLSYRALTTKYAETYSYDPDLPISWNEIPIYPDGYFYALTNKYQIPFDNLDYIYSTKVKDWNGTVITPYFDGYSVSIETPYKYDMAYLYLKDSLRQGNILQSSIYTNNNLEYSSYGYLSSLGNSVQGGTGTTGTGSGTVLITGLLGLVDNNLVSLNTIPDVNIDPSIYYHISVNDINYIITPIDANRGYHINTYTIFKPVGFFEDTNFSEPKMLTNILNNFPTIETKLYSYYSDSNFFFEINTDNNNNIFVGQNNVTFKVVDNYNTPAEGVIIKYQVATGEIVSLGETNSQGFLSDQNISLLLNDLSKIINFYFIFSPDAGFVNNTVVRQKTIESGYSILEDNINLSTYFYRINDSIYFGEATLNNYNILKNSSLSSNLIDLTFTGESNIFNVTEMENVLFTNNSLPKDIDQEQTEIITNLILNNNLNESVDVNELFKNHLKFDNILTMLLDANANVIIDNLGSINYSASYPGPNKGVLYSSTDDIYNIELIKDINPSIVIDYSLSSNTNAIIESITSTTLPEFIDSDVFNNSINVIGQDISSGLIIPINFSVNDEYSGTYPTSHSTITLTFNLLMNNSPVSFTQEFGLDAYNSDSIVNIALTNGNNIEIFCTQDTCTQNKAYEFSKNLNLYKVNLLTPVSLLPTVSNLFVEDLSSNLLLTNTFKSRNVKYNSNYNDLTLEDTTGSENTLFNFEVLDASNPSFNKSLTSEYIIYKLSPEITQSTIGFDYCIGVGGQESGSDIFMLGYCEDQTESCRTGEEYLPKVFFNWGEESLDWNNKCISDNIDDMDTKYACDSLQMLISIFFKIQNPSGTSFYIKLMNDGISQDLLKDFIDYKTTSDHSLFANFNLPNNESLFTPEAVDDGDFKITLNGDDSIKVFTPGIYEVKVLSGPDYYQNTESDSKIDIQLNFKQNLFLSELSVFHYMPFDGVLNQEGPRNGYGIKTNDYENIVSIRSEAPVDLDYSSVTNPINNLFVSNYNNLDNLNNTIDSKGYILDLEKHDDGALQMIFSPSYPIPLYASAACLPIKKLSYNLLRNDTSSLDGLIGSSFLKWNNIDTTFIDQKFTSQDNFFYTLNTSEVTDNYINVSTMLYLPTDLDLTTIKFKTSNLLNSEYTKLFSKSRLDGTDDIIFSDLDYTLGNNLDNLRTIKGIFEYVKSGDACIDKSPQKTTIKWVDTKVNFTQSELDEITSNIPTGYICTTGDIT